MGTRKNRLSKAVRTSTLSLCFEQKYKKYQGFLSENFQFIKVKFAIYLSWRVFEMGSVHFAYKISILFRAYIANA